jgi:hypothetical protein
MFLFQEIILSGLNTIPSLLLLSTFAIQHIVPKMIFFVSQIFWLIPPFKQVRGHFFYYFFILAISEPVCNILYHFAKVPVLYPFTASSFLLMLTIFKFKGTKGKSIIILNTILFILAFFFIQKFAYHIDAIFHLMILANFITIFIKKLFTRQTVNFYLLILIIYEFSTTTMFVLKLAHTKINVAFGGILAIFEMFVCLFFVVYSYKNSPKIRLK